MYRTGKANWRSRLFFGFTGLFFSWATYYLSTNTIDPAYQASIQTAAKGTPLNLDVGDFEELRLSLDVPVTVGPNQFVYKGKQDNCLLIDVLIPALDRGFAYHHAIPMEKAERGFNLAGQELVLISASWNGVRLGPRKLQ